jgi:hypothetical protein
MDERDRLEFRPLVKGFTVTAASLAIHGVCQRVDGCPATAIPPDVSRYRQGETNTASNRKRAKDGAGTIKP